MLSYVAEASASYSALFVASLEIAEVNAFSIMDGKASFNSPMAVPMDAIAAEKSLEFEDLGASTSFVAAVVWTTLEFPLKSPLIKNYPATILSPDSL
jgi:hypothetical protein